MDEGDVSPEVFKEAFIAMNLFASGLSVDYGKSMLIAKPRQDTVKDEETRSLAQNIHLGKRFPDQKVLNQSSAIPVPFQSLLRADGRFHLLVFAGTPLLPSQQARLSAFCTALSTSPLLATHLHTHIRLLTLHASPRVDVELLRDFPEVLRPFDEDKGWDYDSVFVDDVGYHEGGGEAYKGYGVDRVKGYVVLCRPDGYVGWIGGVDEQGVKGLEGYFERVFK